MAAFVCVGSLVCSCAFVHVQIFTRIPNTYCFPRFHACLAKQAFVHAALGRRDLEIRARPQCRQEGLMGIRYIGIWVGWFFFQSLGGWSRSHGGGGDGENCETIGFTPILTIHAQPPLTIIPLNASDW
jgi:hypothetical protein